MLVFKITTIILISYRLQGACVNCYTYRVYTTLLVFLRQYKLQLTFCDNLCRRPTLHIHNDSIKLGGGGNSMPINSSNFGQMGMGIDGFF